LKLLKIVRHFEDYRKKKGFNDPKIIKKYLIKMIITFVLSTYRGVFRILLRGCSKSRFS